MQRFMAMRACSPTARRQLVFEGCVEQISGMLLAMSSRAAAARQHVIKDSISC